MRIKVMIKLINSAKTILSTLYKFGKCGIPSHILLFGESLGDNLLLGILAKELHKRGYKNIWIKCDCPYLYTNNPYIQSIIPFDTLLSTHLLNLFRVKTINPIYTEYQEAIDQNLIPEKHIILKMADVVGIKGELVNKPPFILTPDEVVKGIYSKKQIVISTSNSGAKIPTLNKKWPTERYQQVVDRFYMEYDFIQLGTSNDEPLKNAIDLRSKTTIRESAAILKNSVLMIAYAGFLMHLARAVDCRSVIIYGGREKPEQTGYSGFCNIYSNVECSPCWLNNLCDYNRKCMTLISTDMVINEILKELQLDAKPIIVDVLNNG